MLDSVTTRRRAILQDLYEALETAHDLAWALYLMDEECQFDDRIARVREDVKAHLAEIESKLRKENR